MAEDLKGEVADLRTDMRTEFATIRGEMREAVAALRGEMHAGFASLRVDMAHDRIVQLKWSFAFWLGQLVAIVGFLTLLLRTVGR